MNNNKSLFWYGWKANLKQKIGIVIFGIGIILLMMSWVLTIIFAAAGIYLIATGSAQRFDYQRQSGTIIHKGDWE